jgi:transglutaminase-like putative cysteine protease
MKKLLSVLLTTIVVFPFFAFSDLRAKSPEASSSYKVYFTLDESGVAFVEYKINLENKSDEFYIRDYSLLIEFTDITDLRVLENGSAGLFKKEISGDTTRIKVLLKDHLLYRGDSVNILVQFKTRELFFEQGLLDTLYVPPVKTEETLESANYELTVPDNLEKLSYKSISDRDFEQKGDTYFLSFSQDEAPGGLLLQIGEKQQFDFTFNYRLNSGDESDGNFSITLPPDSFFQKLYIDDVSEEPSRTFSDLDGNILLEYEIGKGDTRDLRISGHTKFSRYEDALGYQPDSIYTKETEYWDYPNETVQQTLGKILRSDYSTKENMRFIYDYLLSNFSYLEESSEDRRKTSDILGDWEYLTCQDYSDAFVGLARGSGIPARAVVGYSFLVSEINSLHYWAEFFDEQSREWVAVDPCLAASVKFDQFEAIDQNRVILAYRGVSDSNPAAVTPFIDFQETGQDSLEIRASSFDFENEEGEVSLNYKVGMPDIFSRNIPLILQVKNSSASIFRLESVLVDSIEVSPASKHLVGDFTESVFPGQSKDLEINLANVNKEEYNRVEDYDLMTRGYFGGETFLKEGQFDIRAPFTLLHVLSWGISLALGVGILFTIYLLKKKFPSLKTRFKRKKKRNKQKIRKSKMSGMIDVPVDLR